MAVIIVIVDKTQLVAAPSNPAYITSHIPGHYCLILPHPSPPPSPIPPPLHSPLSSIMIEGWLDVASPHIYYRKNYRAVRVCSPVFAFGLSSTYQGVTCYKYTVWCIPANRSGRMPHSEQHLPGCPHNFFALIPMARSLPSPMATSMLPEQPPLRPIAPFAPSTLYLTLPHPSHQPHPPTPPPHTAQVQQPGQSQLHRAV